MFFGALTTMGKLLAHLPFRCDRLCMVAVHTDAMLSVVAIHADTVSAVCICCVWLLYTQALCPLCVFAACGCCTHRHCVHCVYLLRVVAVHTNAVQEVSSGCMRTSSPHQAPDNPPGCSKAGMETEVIYDCSNVIQQMQNSRRRMLHRSVTTPHF